MSVAHKLRLFTVDEYYAMAKAGILSEDDRVELLDGQIVTMSPIGSRHAACVDRLAHLMFTRVGSSCIVRIQNPVRLNDFSEPEPDVALLKPRADFYAASHPSPDDVLLIIEVAETSVDSDRRLKLPLYAHSGIQEVWLVVLDEEQVEVYRQPTLEGYAEQHIVHRGQAITTQLLPALNVAVDEVLG